MLEGMISLKDYLLAIDDKWFVVASKITCQKIYLKPICVYYMHKKMQDIDVYIHTYLYSYPSHIHVQFFSKLKHDYVCIHVLLPSCKFFSSNKWCSYFIHWICAGVISILTVSQFKLWRVSWKWHHLHATFELKDKMISQMRSSHVQGKR